VNVSSGTVSPGLCGTNPEIRKTAVCVYFHFFSLTGAVNTLTVLQLYDRLSDIRPLTENLSSIVVVVNCENMFNLKFT